MALALSGYHGEHHAYPADLADLTPKYLLEIPKDPFGEGDFRYKPENGGYVLYSVGQNGVDEGGKNCFADHTINEWLKNSDKYSKAERETDDITIRKPQKNAEK